MSDERIVEVMAERFRKLGPPGRTPEHMASDILAALRDAGWELFRPEDCEEGVIDGATFADNPAGKIGLIVLVPERAVVPDYGSYRLVPVSGESSKAKGDEGE